MWNTKQKVYITVYSMCCLKPWQLFELLRKSSIWKIRCLGLSLSQYRRMCMYKYMLLWINENPYISLLLQMEIKHMHMCPLICLFLLFRSACRKWSVAHNPEEADQVYSNQGILIIMSVPIVLLAGSAKSLALSLRNGSLALLLQNATRNSCSQSPKCNLEWYNACNS